MLPSEQGPLAIGNIDGRIQNEFNSACKAEKKYLLISMIAKPPKPATGALPLLADESGAKLQAGSSLRLLTLNIHKGFSPLKRRFVLDGLRTAIRSVAADIVCLQEVSGEHSERRVSDLTSPRMPQYEFLADSIWQQHAYGRNAVYVGGHHGNAVLSKYPIVSFENHDITIGGSERRGMLHCVLQLPTGVQAHVICLHLGLLERYRVRQVDILCALIRDHIPADAPLFVAGDFNDWRERAHEPLRRCGGLAELYLQAKGRSARSFPARWPLLRLDRIYHRNLLNPTPVNICQKPWSQLSDHLPLALECSV